MPYSNGMYGDRRMLWQDPGSLTSSSNSPSDLANNRERPTMDRRGKRHGDRRSAPPQQRYPDRNMHYPNGPGGPMMGPGGPMPGRGGPMTGPGGPMPGPGGPRSAPVGYGPNPQMNGAPNGMARNGQFGPPIIPPDGVTIVPEPNGTLPKKVTDTKDQTPKRRQGTRRIKLCQYLGIICFIAMLGLIGFAAYMGIKDRNAGDEDPPPKCLTSKAPKDLPTVAATDGQEGLCEVNANTSGIHPHPYICNQFIKCIEEKSTEGDNNTLIKTLKTEIGECECGFIFHQSDEKAYCLQTRLGWYNDPDNCLAFHYCGEDESVMKYRIMNQDFNLTAVMPAEMVKRTSDKCEPNSRFKLPADTDTDFLPSCQPDLLCK